MTVYKRIDYYTSMRACMKTCCLMNISLIGFYNIALFSAVEQIDSPLCAPVFW